MISFDTNREYQMRVYINPQIFWKEVSLADDLSDIANDMEEA